jgi:uncharacterized protein YdaU (DUF1376 family)
MTHIIEVPFHIGDFLSGTIHMDAEQTGAYMMLIVAHYNAGAQGLPNDDAQLARIARVSPRVWKRIKPILEPKFNKNKNFWVHEKCVKVLQKIQEKSDAAKSNALKRHGTGHADANPPQSNGNANHEPCNQKPDIQSKKNKNGNSCFHFSGRSFDGKVIALDGPSFNEWFQVFSNDGDEDRFRRLIQNRDKWYATQPYNTHKNWLMDTTKWLAKNQKRATQ